ncbi:UNVERIFIED_CONTAM: hypothetical protein Cloal_2350 [Acetivibrio alkalicellulosi]
MSKINQIQNAIRELSGGAYQKLMDAYLYKRFEFKNIMPLGSHAGTDKTTKGTPDSYVITDEGKFILIVYGSVSEKPYSKLENDILSCLDELKTGIKIKDISQIICCHTSTNISPGQCKQICKHYENTMLIGLGELSQDLFFKYQAIAKDFLSIQIDTNQIFDKREYIEYTSRNIYSTPLDTTLICREKEITDLLKLLNKEKVIMILGKSGVGKTRLALEAAELYRKENNCIVKIIKSNNESIYDDLHSTFTDDKDFLVVIDDADQLTQINHLFDLCTSRKRKHSLKVLMTVRNYAKEILLKRTKKVLEPSIYKLESLDDNCIEKIIVENYNIKNDITINKIKNISKGNIRLAIMAAECGNKGSFESINNAFDIFDIYFAEIIDSMNRKEIITATLIAFFDSLILREKEKPIQIAIEKGIDFEEFIEICYSLHNKEIVSIFNDLAIKFEDQNLRDYLLYYVFCKEKWITPSYMIRSTFFNNTKRVIYAFNTIVDLFRNKEIIQYIDTEIKKSWAEIKVQSSDRVFQFVKSFYEAIPLQTLSFIKQEIDQMSEEHTDFGTYDFDKTSNVHAFESEIIELLTGFKYTKYFEEALQVAFYFLEKNSKYPMDFYFFFGEKLGFDKNSYKYSFEKERFLLEKLIEYYKDKNTLKLALCLTFCISNCLRYHFSETESKQNKTVNFIQFDLPKCKEIFEIRSRCFEALAFMFYNIKHKRFTIKTLLDYSGYFKSGENKLILEKDILAFTNSFSNLLDTKNFENCMIIHHFQTICEQRSVSYPQMLLEFKNNHIFMLYLSIYDYDKIDLNINTEDYKNEIYKFSLETTDEEFDSLWISLKSYNFYHWDQWTISRVIKLLFESFKNNRNKFVKILKSYIKHGTPFGDQFTCNVLVNKLIDILGYDNALKFISSVEFINKSMWINCIYNNIPDSKIKEKTPKYFIEKLLEQRKEDGVYTLSLTTVFRINLLYQGFIIKYVEAMNGLDKKYHRVISTFLNQIDMRNSFQSSEFVNSFKDNLNVLKIAYINALKSGVGVDRKRQLLIQIVKKDINYISTFVKEILSNNSYYINHINLDIFWNQDNYDELVTVFMKALKENLRPSFYEFNWIGERLLTCRRGKSEQCLKQDNWINNYIKKNNEDMDSTIFIFEIIRQLSNKRKKDSILLFCKYNCLYSDFRKIRLMSNIISWSGSKVPILEDRISFLNDIKDELKGFNYIEHRAYLDECIQKIQDEKESVLLQEFIEDC